MDSNSYISSISCNSGELITIRKLEWIYSYNFLKFLSSNLLDLHDFRGISKMIIEKSDSYDIPDIMKSIYDGDCFILCAFNKINDIIGFSGVFKKFNIGNFEIFIDNQYRNKGVGNILINTTLKYSNHLDIQNINLSVRDNNENAIKLYKKNGFKKIKTIKNNISYKKAIVNEVIMSIELNY